MYKLNDLTFGLIGPGVFAWRGPRGSGALSPLKPAKITTQPPSFSLFQENGKLEIKGAVVQDAVSLVWQMKDQNTWKDTAFKTADLSWSNAIGDDVIYRLKAVGEDGVAVYSNEVTAYNVYLKLQDDTAPTAAIKNSNTSYSWATGAGGKYVGALFFKRKDDSTFTPPGAAGGRALATWATSNQTVAPVTGTGQPGSGNVQASGQWRPSLTAGTATVTATYGNLKSTLAITVS